MAKSSSCRVGTSAILLSVLLCATLSGATGSAVAKPPARARAARVLNASDTAHLHYLPSKSSGSQLFEEGSATGTLPGSMRVYCDVGPTLTATFTIYTHGGSIVGHGTGTPHGSGTYESFAGSLVVTGGTGRYAHARGRAGLYGTLNRRTYAMTVQTTGSLSY